MNIHNSAEIHFHQQEQISIFLETAVSGLEQEFGEIALMTCFCIRILSNLAVNDTSDRLARLLLNGPQAVKEFALGTSTGGFELIPYPGYKGRRQFNLDMILNQSTFNFQLAQIGFGFLARGYGFYAPIGVFGLLRYLSHHRCQNDIFLSSLGESVAFCGSLHLERQITLQNHRELGMAAIATCCGDNYLSRLLPD